VGTNKTKFTIYCDLDVLCESSPEVCPLQFIFAFQIPCQLSRLNSEYSTNTVTVFHKLTVHIADGFIPRLCLEYLYILRRISVPKSCRMVSCVMKKTRLRNVGLVPTFTPFLFGQ
jgi:hypothetical protein